MLSHDGVRVHGQTIGNRGSAIEGLAPEAPRGLGNRWLSQPRPCASAAWPLIEAGPIMSDVRDSNGTALKDGDSVTLVKDLKVKGTSVTLKRGILVKNIRLTDDPGEIECNADKVKGLVLKTEFLKRA